ncbi:MAG: LysR family transcriptional regulator [Proteobacteria bacterium]|nr:MAG: LysR family transcriptional regulator [Pseudomonadota bacterium]
MAIMNNISYDDIKLFVTVYESRSYTISAVKHNTSQPTVSRKIKQLEDHLQQKLFYYKNNIIWPTDFAQSLYESCHSTFKNLDDIISHLTAQTEAQEYSGTVRIQLPVIISKYIISPQIPYLLRKYPKLDLQIIYSNLSPHFFIFVEFEQ